MLAWLLLPLWGEAKPPPLSLQEAASAVQAHADWKTLAEKCPAEVMAPERAWDHVRCGPTDFSACLSRCEARDGDACYWLAQELQGGKAGAASETLFQRSCALGVVSGCTNRAAGMLDQGPDRAAANRCAQATFERTCRAEDPWGCTMWALMLTREPHGPQDRAKALKALSESCRYGDEDEACAYGKRLKAKLEAEEKP